MKQFISVKTYANLCNVSERTIRRYIATNAIDFISDSSSRTLIAIGEVEKKCIIQLDSHALELILLADKGDVEAQGDLAVLFFEYSKASLAIYWLNLAAKQQSADAMQLLGCCYGQGLGVVKDNNRALMWISKAADAGSLLALRQVGNIFSNA
jgi:TPR repeat protein